MAEADCGQQIVQNSISGILGRSLFPSIQPHRSLPIAPVDNFIHDYQQFIEPVQRQAEILSGQQVAVPEALHQPIVPSPGVEAPINYMQPNPFFGNFGMPHGHFDSFLPRQAQPPIHEYIRDSANTIDLRQDSQWIDSISSRQPQDTIELPKEIQEFVTEGKNQLSYEERRAESKFYKFLHDYKTGELFLGDEALKEEFEAMNGQKEEIGHSNEQEHGDWIETSAQSLVDEFNEQHSNTFEDAWDEGTQSIENWAEEYMTGHEGDQTNLSMLEYPFVSENPYLHQSDPFTEGQNLLQSGAIAAASLAFEAECQRASPHPEAWYMLGTTQQENEKDTLAIIALHRAIENEPTNSNAHLALATSQTNEYMYSEALQSLHSWMNTNPVCQNTGISGDSLKDSIEHVLLNHPQDIDAHVALGTYHNIHHEYRMGIDAFRNALAVNPNSASLWNKLGASLANSGDWDGAMDAYRNALGIAPTSHRCMYNHAVGLTNNGQNMNAIHQLARLLQGQENSSTSSQFEDARRKSDDVWNLVRINAENLGNNEVLQFVENENIDGLCRSLGIA